MFVHMVGEGSLSPAGMRGKPVAADVMNIANDSQCHDGGDGRSLIGATPGSVTRYELKQNAIERLSVNCAS